MTKKWFVTISHVLVLSFLCYFFFWRLLTPNTVDRLRINPEGDFIQHYYAFSEYQAIRLLNGEFPLWNPYNHAGDPFAGNIQSAAFYPPRLLAIALSGDWSVEWYQLEIIWHVWMASLFMYAFLRALLKRPDIALIGSILYAYGGYLTGYPIRHVSIMESVVWLPLILYGIQLSQRHLQAIVISGIAIACSLMGGHPQTTMQITYLGVAYLIFITWERGWLAIGSRLLLMGIIGAGLSAIQLLPAWEFTQLTSRVSNLGIDDKANGFTPSEFLQALIPKLYTTWSPLYISTVGVLLAIMTILRPQKQTYFWIGVIVVGGLLSLGGGSIVYDFFYRFIPGFDMFRQQERIASLVSFALVMLAVNQLIKQPRQSIIYIALGITAILYMWASLTESHYAEPIGFSLIIVLLIIGWLHLPRPYYTVGLIIIIVIDLFTVGTRSDNYVSAETQVYLPPSLATFQDMPPEAITWRVDGGAGLLGDGITFRIPDIYGSGPFTLESIERLRTIPVDRFWEVLSVRYSTLTTEPPENMQLDLRAYDLNAKGEEFRLFELVDPRPLAHLVYDYRDASGSPEFARQIMADPNVNLREMGITLYPLNLDLPGERPAVSSVESLEIITPEYLKIRISTETDALLTVAIVNYPGWKATIDGNPVPIVDNYAGLIGIPMHAGMDQVVELRFEPDSIQNGLMISLGTLIFAVVFVLSSIHYRKNHE